jgi:predicted nucleotidyltransferase
MVRRLYSVDARQRTQILDDVQSVLAPIPAIVFAFVFGSFLDLDRFHDLDVGIYLKPYKPEHASALSLELIQELDRRVKLPVDVRILNAAPVSFTYHVLRGQLVFCRDEDLLAEVIERSVQRYLDIAPILRHSTHEAFAT